MPRKQEQLPLSYFTPINHEQYKQMIFARKEVGKFLNISKFPPDLRGSDYNTWRIVPEYEYVEKLKSPDEKLLFRLYQNFAFKASFGRLGQDVLNAIGGHKFLKKLRDMVNTLQRIDFEPFSSIWDVRKAVDAVNAVHTWFDDILQSKRVGRPNESHRRLAKELICAKFSCGNLQPKQVATVLIAYGIFRPDTSRTWDYRINSVVAKIRTALPSSPK